MKLQQHQDTKPQAFNLELAAVHASMARGSTCHSDSQQFDSCFRHESARERKGELLSYIFGWSVNRKYLSLIHICLCLIIYNTLEPFAVSLKVIPRTSAAPRHIIIRPRKISKYSYMVQILVSICRFRAITCFSVSTFSFASITA